MPAISKAQGRLMRIALAYKKGHLNAIDVSDTAKNLANSMTTMELEKFARTALDRDAPRTFGVVEPLLIEITNL